MELILDINWLSWLNNLVFSTVIRRMLLFRKGFEEMPRHADNTTSMARVAPVIRDPDEIDFKEVKARFFALNKRRLQRTMGDLRQRQREFITLLPLLFHTNHPTLPGYISKATPAGIPDYSPDSSTLGMAKKLAKSFSYKRRAYRRYYIEAIYLMGSTGTIAYSNTSDFDIWICHDPSLKPELISELEGKARAIEQWAASMDVDAHLFLVNPETFRQGQHGALSSESSGTALHYLLLEEFYRTSLLLAGRYPIWWLVPPEHEHRYDEYVSDIKTKRFVHGRDSIDLGGLNRFPAEEFYGATLWSLYKAINSPYKSVLKTLLMETYASEFPDIDILGLRFKQAVYAGEDDINLLDPYLMMLHKVEEYLQGRKEQARINLIRRSFYFKVNERLSDSSIKETSWRRDLLTELTCSWGWSGSHLFMLDSKDSWKIQRVIEERNQLMHEMTNSYRFLSEFARRHSESNQIDARDLNLLGRKLYVAFERKAGKVDIIYRGITDGLYESHLSLHRLSSDDGTTFWVVFNGLVTEQEVHQFPPLRRAQSIIEILAWCYFNKVISPQTKLAVYAYDSDLNEKEVYTLVADLEKHFPHELLEADNLADLRRPARIKQMLTVVNAGLDPFTARTRRGEHLTSNRTDSFRFGGRLENLTNCLEQIIVTSWNEVHTHRYTGTDGLFEALRDYLRWSSDSMQPNQPPINAVSYSSYRGNAIAARVENLFDTMTRCFSRDHDPAQTHFIMAIEWDYYLLEMQTGDLRHRRLGKRAELQHYLASPSQNFRHVVFDPQAFTDDILPVLYRHNRQGQVQVYFHIKQDYVHTYILDERGTLFTQDTEFYDAVSLINHYEHFFNAINKRMQYLQNGQQPALDYAFFYIEKNQDYQWKIIRHRTNNLFKAQEFINLQIIADKSANEILFKAYCNDREYSSLEHGERLFDKIADYIVGLRRQRETYPIYITDIDLSKDLLGPDYNQVQTALYLNYKKLFETRLLERLQA